MDVHAGEAGWHGKVGQIRPDIAFQEEPAESGCLKRGMRGAQMRILAR